jgi:hypothetical protein
MTFSLRQILLAASFTLMLANSGRATTVYLRDDPGGDGPFRTGSYRSGAGYINSWHGRAGLLEFEMSNTGPNGAYFDLLTYCADPFRTLAVGPVNGEGGAFTVTTLTDFLSSNSARDKIERLWSLAFVDSQSTATKAAAFQFLLWEYIADTSTDFSNGNVRITDADVLSQARLWNRQLMNYTNRSTLLVLDGRAENKQSFFYEQTLLPPAESPVPEPQTFALIGVGLISTVLIRRRRKS